MRPTRSTYRVTRLPGFDRNLRNLSAKLEPTCLVAHVRGVTDAEYATVAESNLHPFHFPVRGWASRTGRRSRELVFVLDGRVSISLQLPGTQRSRCRASARAR